MSDSVNFLVRKRIVTLEALCVNKLNKLTTIF